MLDFPAEAPLQGEFLVVLFGVTEDLPMDKATESADDAMYRRKQAAKAGRASRTAQRA